jgi:hypothetical protein
MPLVYCDHNFVVTAHAAPDPYRRHLGELVANGNATFILSSQHWIEMAEDRDLARGIATADFVDSLRPRWLFTRRSIERKEVGAAFFRFAGVPSDLPEMMGDVRDIIRDLVGQAVYRDSRSFVTHIRDIGACHPLRSSLQSALEANEANGVRFRAGRFTQEFQRGIERLYVEQLLPARTPANVVIDAGTKRRFLDAYQLSDFPSIVLETKATFDNWRAGRQLNRNNFMDQQHLIALPYADLFVTDDRALTNLVTRIAAGLPFRTAIVLTKSQFDLQFP